MALAGSFGTNNDNNTATATSDSPYVTAGSYDDNLTGDVQPPP
jgi:hypothetical protein